jgi:hypothetical protein
MKKVIFIFILITSTIVSSCIGEDIRQDEISEELRILNPIGSIVVSESYKFNTSFFNNIGEIDNSSTVVWSSSNEAVASIDTSGLLSTLTEGTTIITAQIEDGSSIITETSLSIIVTLEPTEIETPPANKSGTITTTSSYRLEGDFTITEIENTNNILISIADNYTATTSLPGLYVYLSNNPNSINGALELGAVTEFNGAHTYTVSNTNINNYTYILYWCKPFGVKVGEGKINN